MSQDKENNLDNLAFGDSTTNDDQKNLSENPFVGDPQPFGDSGFPFPFDESAQPAYSPTESVAEVTEGLGNFPIPDVNISDSEVPTLVETETKAVDPKAKKKERKGKKEKMGKTVKTSDKNKREPLALGATLSLIFGFILLTSLIFFNILILVFPPYKELGVGFSSIVYYLIGVDVIGGIGIVAVPFMYYYSQKGLDVFKVFLGVSAMALSFGVILLWTTWLRYDFIQKPNSSLPSLVAPDLNPLIPVTNPVQ